MCGLHQINAQCIFAESRPYYQTARISRSDVKVVLCLNMYYAINKVWRVELCLHVPASQHTRVEPLVSIR